jgi:hypothetical protein
MNQTPIEDLLAETVAAEAPGMRFEHPDVYSHLIEGENDLTGIIAYSIYKREKRDWRMRWEASHGEPPTPEQTEAFVLANLTEGQKQRYRIAAKAVLDAYLGQHASDLGAEAPLVDMGLTHRMEAAVDRVEAAAGRLRRSQTFLGQVLAGAVGAALMAVIVVGGWFALRAAGIDPLTGLSFLRP